MKTLLIVCSLVMLNCDDDPRDRALRSDVGWLTNGLTYYKDTRTSLCFAGDSIGAYSGTLTNVPCTSEVESLVKKFSIELPK